MKGFYFCSFIFNLVIFVCSETELKPSSGRKCGYQGCPKIEPNKLNVHLVAHTHDDVGWLKTVDQYYYGTKPEIQRACVKKILDSVIRALSEDPKRRFIYVESAYFFKWWGKQKLQVRNRVRELVEEGRLEFIGGAWSMNDEATTHYQSTIDQFAWGLRLLNDTFGECARPRIGWQIDPFGHSREMASMFAQMGYDGLFLGRVDYQDKKKRLQSKTADMIWRSSPNLGASAALFTEVLYNQYSSPEGFCFDSLCSGDQISGNGIDSGIREFVRYVRKQSKHYRTNNIILTMGGDFQYIKAEHNFKKMDELIKYTNKWYPEINSFYSTPSCYLKALHSANISWPTKDDDFFPYASDNHAFWTGYFSSRPTLKRFEREGNNLLQVSKQLLSFAPYKSKDMEDQLTALREAMGIMQHHDAITGTEKQQVAYDYAKKLYKAMEGCLMENSRILRWLRGNRSAGWQENRSASDSDNFNSEFCWLRNISQCPLTENNDRFAATIYNPLGQVINEYVRLPVSSMEYEIFDFRGKMMHYQIVPVPAEVMQLSFRKSNSSHELVFLAKDLPPLGYKSYYFSKISSSFKANTKKSESEQNNEIAKDSSTKDISIGNQNINLTFSNGLLSQVSFNGVVRNMTQYFMFYTGHHGPGRASGAYIFRPATNHSYTEWKEANITVFRGSFVEEVHQTFTPYVSQVVRVYKDKNYAEFEWLVGPIPKDSSKEVVTRFETDIKSKDIFYTDSNGREMIERKRNHRDTWSFHSSQKISANYYPVTSRIALEDDEARLAILVDRPQGGSSLREGALELMVHRRLLVDDGFGVSEALNEVAYKKGLIARGRHRVFIGSSKSSSTSMKAEERFEQLRFHLSPWVFLRPARHLTVSEWTSKYNNTFSGVSSVLPRNVHFLTLESWHKNELLIRLEHIFEKNEDKNYSQAVTVNLKEILNNFKIIDIKDMTLDGNQLKANTKRLKFHMNDETILENLDDDFNSKKFKDNANGQNNKYLVSLEPMEIKTFILIIDENEKYFC